MRTTRKHFEIFEAAVRKWRERLRITGWQVYITHEDVDNAYAQIHTDYPLRSATVTLSKNWDHILKLTAKNLEETARHEMVHLLTAPLRLLALTRCVSVDEIEGVEEALVCSIEALIEDMMGVER